MDQLKPAERQVFATALGFAFVVALAVPLFAQDPPPVTDQDGPMVTTGQPSLEQQSDPPRQRQLSNVPDDIGYQLQESEGRVDAIFPVGPLTPLHHVICNRALSVNRAITRTSIAIDAGATR